MCVYVPQDRKNCLNRYKVYMTVILTTLFKEDNIFGMNVSLTYGPQLQTNTCV